jgi:gliding motility-associated-like protein
MKTISCFLLLTVFCVTASAQTFEMKSTYKLPDTVAFHDSEWIDADNDGLLDVMAFARNSKDEEILYLFKNDSQHGLQFMHHFNTRLTEAAWYFDDFDDDNIADILISGYENGQGKTAALLNRGAYFERSAISNAAGSLIRSADFNQDGFREILLSGENSGEPFLRILRRQSSGWTVVYDSISIQASGVEVFDFDADNDVDLFVTGRDESGGTVTRAFYNQKGFYFTAENYSPGLEGPAIRADLNHDGAFDLVTGGKDSNNEDRLLIFLNDDGHFIAKDTLMPARRPQILAADFNSDGICDINVLGFSEGGDTLNLVYTAQPTTIVAHNGVVSQAFGDGERDGDLDLVQLTNSLSGYGLRILENVTPATNFSPRNPSKPILANIFNRLFMYWQKPTDDRTPINSLTYDVSVRSTGQNIITPQFDIFNGRRLTVSHGNNGTANYVLIRVAVPAPVSFDIQSVDNSFHAGLGSICKGSGGSGSGLCSEIETIAMEACRSERITLASEQGAHWFSFKDGFLADTSVLVFNFQQPDTIFSVLYRESGCSKISVYTLGKGENVTKNAETVKHVCEGQLFHAGVEGFWSAVEWSSTAKGFISNDDTVHYAVTVADTLKVKVADESGCAIQRNTVLIISKPEVETVHDAYQILKGESVQFGASGGATYEWHPVSGLSDPGSASPVATPLRTTEYSVLVKDTLGCVARARIIVIVEETAFVPNLFTPNRDGANDVLRIYGLGQVSGFSFTIFNRDGARVYHTNNISEAVTLGWNGTAAGVDQPSGVYYWNVKGETATGTRLKLNGKNSGSIVLVR